MAEIYNFSTFRKEKNKVIELRLYYKKIHKKRQNDRKVQYTLASENWNCFLIEVTGPKKRTIFEDFKVIYQKQCFSIPVTSFLPFWNFSQKCARVYPPFQSFCLLWNLWRSNFFDRTSPKWCSIGSPGSWIIYFFTKTVDNYHRRIHWKN